MTGKVKIHRNDTVEVIAGKEKGKRGEVVKVLREENKAELPKSKLPSLFPML